MASTALTLHTDARVGPHTIVVPVGLEAAAADARSAAAFRVAALLARPAGARVVLVCATGVPEDWHLWEPHASKAEAVERTRRDHAELRLIRAAQALYYEGVPVEAVVLRRVDVAEAIAHAAEDAGADLIVMGTPCLSGGDRVPEDCVARRVVERAACAVFTVHCGGALTKPAAFPERIALVSRLAAAEGSRWVIALAAALGVALDVCVVLGGRAPREGGARASEPRPEDVRRLAALLGDASTNGGGGRPIRAEVVAAATWADAVRAVGAQAAGLGVVADPPHWDVLSGLPSGAGCWMLAHRAQAPGTTA